MSKKQKMTLILIIVLTVTLILFAMGLGIRASVRLMDLRRPVGGNWDTWRGYSRYYSITENLTVTFSVLDMEAGDSRCGYGIYDTENGSRIGNLILEERFSQKRAQPWNMDFQTEDLDGDGWNEIGVPLDDGTMLWYSMVGKERASGFIECPLIAEIQENSEMPQS